MNKSTLAFTFAFGFASSAIIFSVVQALTQGPAAPKPLVVTKTEVQTIYRNVPVEHVVYQKSPVQLVTQIEYISIPTVCPPANAPAEQAPQASPKEEANSSQKNLVYALVGQRETYGDLQITNNANEYSAVLPKKNE